MVLLCNHFHLHYCFLKLQALQYEGGLVHERAQALLEKSRISKQRGTALKAQIKSRSSCTS